MSETRKTPRLNSARVELCFLTSGNLRTWNNFAETWTLAENWVNANVEFRNIVQTMPDSRSRSTIKFDREELTWRTTLGGKSSELSPRYDSANIRKTSLSDERNLDSNPRWWCISYRWLCYFATCKIFCTNLAGGIFLYIREYAKNDNTQKSVRPKLHLRFSLQKSSHISKEEEIRQNMRCPESGFYSSLWITETCSSLKQSPPPTESEFGTALVTQPGIHNSPSQREQLAHELVQVHEHFVGQILRAETMTDNLMSQRSLKKCFPLSPRTISVLDGLILMKKQADGVQHVELLDYSVCGLEMQWVLSRKYENISLNKQHSPISRDFYQAELPSTLILWQWRIADKRINPQKIKIASLRENYNVVHSQKLRIRESSASKNQTNRFRSDSHKQTTLYYYYSITLPLEYTARAA